MMKFNEITKKLNFSVINSSLTNHPDNNPNIIGLAPVDEAITGQLSYIEGNKFATLVNKTAASALILPLNEDLQNQARDSSECYH
jgi:UDP-3-O-[3-hydroxymyristoyl] glucosamine N-acyltransferase